MDRAVFSPRCSFAPTFGVESRWSDLVRFARHGSKLCLGLDPWHRSDGRDASSICETGSFLMHELCHCVTRIDRRCVMKVCHDQWQSEGVEAWCGKRWKNTAGAKVVDAGY